MNLRPLFFKHLAQTSPSPLALEITKAKGVYLYDKDGKEIIDLISGISVANIGHGHPHIIEAVKQQAEQYLQLMVYGEFIQKPQVLLAEKLCSFLPETLNSVYFVNSGSEAVEGALKLARRYTEKSEFIACEKAYHGCTMGAMSVMGSPDFKKNFGSLIEDVQFIRHGNVEDLTKITSKTAAVIIEPVQGEAGIRTAENSYWQALRQRCTETGTLLIFDEIQTGMGRTGKLFAFEHADITPDILLLAKAFGGGMPLGAFITSQEIMHVLTHNPVLGHITTFGGHPVSCAAALANMNIITESKLWLETEEKSQRFENLLSKHQSVAEIRHQGLMIAVELNDSEKVQKLISEALKNGVLTDWFLFCDTAFRIAPPLTISLQEIEKACGILRNCLDKLL